MWYRSRYSVVDHRTRHKGSYRSILSPSRPLPYHWELRRFQAPGWLSERRQQWLSAFRQGTRERQPFPLSGVRNRNLHNPPTCRSEPDQRQAFWIAAEPGREIFAQRKVHTSCHLGHDSQHFRTESHLLFHMPSGEHVRARERLFFSSANYKIEIVLRKPAGTEGRITIPDRTTETGDGRHLESV